MKGGGGIQFANTVYTAFFVCALTLALIINVHQQLFPLCCHVGCRWRQAYDCHPLFWLICLIIIINTWPALFGHNQHRSKIISSGFVYLQLPHTECSSVAWQHPVPSLRSDWLKGVEGESTVKECDAHARMMSTEHVTHGYRWPACPSGATWGTRASRTCSSNAGPCSPTPSACPGYRCEKTHVHK